MDIGIEGKVSLVTGGSRGIGRATATVFAEEGCKVGICARGESKLLETLEELRALESDAWGVTADVTNAADVESFISTAADRFGGLDILVCNVGGLKGDSTLEATDEDWLTTYEVNVVHAVRSVRAAIPYMKKRDGASIVLVASISGMKPGPHGQYGSAKASAIFLSSTLAWELAEHRIRVNTVSPGSIYFPGGGWSKFESKEPQLYNRFLDNELPWNRLGTDREVANVIAFLCSERARWINGANIPVDGGQARPTGQWFNQ